MSHFLLMDLDSNVFVRLLINSPRWVKERFLDIFSCQLDLYAVHCNVSSTYKANGFIISLDAHSKI